MMTAFIADNQNGRLKVIVMEINGYIVEKNYRQMSQELVQSGKFVQGLCLVFQN